HGADDRRRALAGPGRGDDPGRLALPQQVSPRRRPRPAGDAGRPAAADVPRRATAADGCPAAAVVLAAAVAAGAPGGGHPVLRLAGAAVLAAVEGRRGHWLGGVERPGADAAAVRRDGADRRLLAQYGGAGGDAAPAGGVCHLARVP